MENKKVRIIQFIHPGHEHQLNHRQIKNNTTTYDWNFRQHKRKFMHVKGSYVDNDKLNKSDEMYFWGEWEPTSNIFPISGQNINGDYPKFIHEPFLDTSFQFYPPYTLAGKNPVSYHRQNTDPFVFGNNFTYCLCKQDHYNKLRELAAGSIILFGSCINPRTDAYFALDTVFIVGESNPYKPTNFQNDLQGKIPANYGKIMGFADWNDDKEKMLYKGVTFENKERFKGMYSFAPCKLNESGRCGFERIKLRSSDLDIITDNLAQGLKCTESNLDTNKEYWDKICSIIQNQGCLKGVHFDYTRIS